MRRKERRRAVAKLGSFPARILQLTATETKK
jgi:hypothetical protein